MVHVESRRPCAFCGQVRKLTKEHLFRDSLRGRIPASTELIRERSNGSGFYERTHIPVSIFDITVREVCGPCNHGWMNDIDLSVEDLLVELANGRRMDIPASQVQGMSRWATRIAMLRTLSERARVGHANPLLFREFFESRLPPTGTYIRVAVLPHLAYEGGSNSHARFVPKNIGPRSTSFDNESSLNIVTWGIGYLLVHVVLASPGSAFKYGHEIDRVLSLMGGAMPRLWPNPRRPVTVTAGIDPADLDHLSSVGFLLMGSPPAPSPRD